MGTNTVDEADLKKVESKAEEICKKKFPFQRLVLSKEQALQLFADNPFKVKTCFLRCINLYFEFRFELLKRRFPMARKRRFTVVDHSLICAWDLTCHTRAKLRHSQR
jgi:hypothetical protein